MKNWLWVNANNLIQITRNAAGLFINDDRIGALLDKMPVVARSVAPTRFGEDSADRLTPFVETRAHLLRRYYNGYDNRSCRDFKLSYEELVTFGEFQLPDCPQLDLTAFNVTLRDKEWKVDPRLKRHGNAACEIFTAIGKLHRQPDGQMMNELNLRLSNWDVAGKSLALAPTRYNQQVGTNLTLDWASGHLSRRNSMTLSGHINATTRNDLDFSANGQLTALRDSCLANVIGVACMLYTAKGHALIRARSGATAIMADRDKMHCSASGAVTFPDDPAKLSSGKEFENYLYAEMAREIQEETGLGPEDYELRLVAFARELVRGGHPQFFFSAQTKLERPVIEERLRTATDRWEFRDSEELEERLKMFQSDPVAYLDTYSEIFTYEGFAALMLTAAFKEQCGD